jgi:hypothetical protein
VVKPYDPRDRSWWRMLIVASSRRTPYIAAALLAAGAGQVRGILQRSVSPGLAIVVSARGWHPVAGSGTLVM